MCGAGHGRFASVVFVPLTLLMLPVSRAEAATPAVPSPASRSAASPSSDSDLPPSLDEARKRRHRYEQLDPDRRFFLSIVQVSQLFGDAIIPTTARTDSGWRLQ